MNAFFRLIPTGAFFLVLAAWLAACDTGPADSLYEPDPTLPADPTVTSVEPGGAALAGVDVLTITGQNFSTDPADNLVYFNDARGEVLEATATQLRVRTPNTPAPELMLRVVVVGAENFSNEVPYRLDAAAARFAQITDFEEPFALASDEEGNLYMSLFSSNVSAGIKRISPDGTRSDYVSTTFKWDDLVFGPDGYLYAVRRIRALFRFPPGGGEQETWATVEDRSVRLAALDFDANGNLWTGGNSTELYRIAPDQTITPVPFEADVRALKVFDGALYVAAVRGDAAGVWRLPIQADGSLGPEEQVFDLAAFDPAAQPTALEAAANGDLFLGTDAAPDPVVVVHPDGSWDVLYPGILSPAAISFAWGTGTTLYMTQGRTDATVPDLVRIETRREGAR